MGTSFFHESHFQGLLERVRERGRANVAQRVADQVSRLFHQSDVSDPCHSQLTFSNCHEDGKCGNAVSDSPASTVIGSNKHSEVGVAKKQEGTIQDVSEVSEWEGRSRQITIREVNGVSVLECGGSTSNPLVLVASWAVNGCGSSAVNDSCPSRDVCVSENSINLEQHVVTASDNLNCNTLREPDDMRQTVKEQHCTASKSDGGTANRTSKELRVKSDARQSGVARNVTTHNGCYGSPVAVSAKGRQATFPDNSPVNVTSSSEAHKSRHLSDVAGATVGTQCGSPLSLSLVSNSHVCVKLCSLIKAQLVKAHGEVTRRFGGNQGLMTLSDAFNTRSPVDNGSNKDGSVAEEEQQKVDVPEDNKRGKETVVVTETVKPEEEWDPREITHSEREKIKLLSSSIAATAELPQLSEKVKDGLKDMLHALSRLGGGQAVASQCQPAGVKSSEVEKEEVLAGSTAASVEAKDGQGSADPAQNHGEEVVDEACGEGKLLPWNSEILTYFVS
jgi:hypothetical protein